MFGKGLIKGMGITLKHGLEKNITVQYPEERPHLYRRFRGSLAFDFKHCIVCGMCVKACPNHVLSMETVRDEQTRKKKLVSYTIDLQYCLFCNLCVEACPQHGLYFTHDFELSQPRREDIKVVYTRPPELDRVPPKGGEMTDQGTGTVNPNVAATAEDKQKKVEKAVKAALMKNPGKALGGKLDADEDLAILMELLQADDRVATRLAKILVQDRDQAKKVAVSLVNRKKKEWSREGGESV